MGDKLNNYLAKDTADAVSKVSSTITYGPFQNLPETATLVFQQREQIPANIHYEYENPVLTVVKLKRAAEVSHWGANLNIQDDIVLRNDGPTYALPLSSTFILITYISYPVSKAISPV